MTLYLDEETDAKARAAAAAAGVSYSRWVAEIIRSRTRDQWPEQIRALAGSIRDFPRREEPETHAIEPGDSPRIPLDD
ncbi:MAG: hypothetical protein MUF07_11165 [Steroidobacteraceae bacterium]|nr:hypothetical protein [Steroidobacteraceae bacterium]